jgi:hypothetical protein
MELKVLLLPEQPKAVFDFPDDLGVSRGLGLRGFKKPREQGKGSERQEK